MNGDGGEDGGMENRQPISADGKSMVESSTIASLAQTDLEVARACSGYRSPLADRLEPAAEHASTDGASMEWNRRPPGVPLPEHDPGQPSSEPALAAPASPLVHSESWTRVIQPTTDKHETASAHSFKRHSLAAAVLTAVAGVAAAYLHGEALLGVFRPTAHGFILHTEMPLSAAADSVACRLRSAVDQRIVFVGDVHGDVGGLKTILRSATHCALYRQTCIAINPAISRCGSNQRRQMHACSG
jgi:hypothetical protein